MVTSGCSGSIVLWWQRMRNTRVVVTLSVQFGRFEDDYFTLRHTALMACCLLFMIVYYVLAVFSACVQTSCFLMLYTFVVRQSTRTDYVFERQLPIFESSIRPVRYVRSLGSQAIRPLSVHSSTSYLRRHRPLKFLPTVLQFYFLGQPYYFVLHKVLTVSKTPSARD